MESQLGTYHLADNPQLYDPIRTNNFEFVVEGINGLLKAGYLGVEDNARFKNAEEVLRVSVSSAFVPHFSQSPIEVKRGNTTIKYAGVPTFSEGSLKFNDWIGAQTTEALMAWQRLSYDVTTEKVGALQRSNYKKTCYLRELAPDNEPVRVWALYGCWISSLSTAGAPDYESNTKQQVNCTIQYDKAILLKDNVNS